jgi:hypothetical protein
MRSRARHILFDADRPGGRPPIAQRPEAAAVTAEHCPNARALSAGDGAIASAGLASVYKYDESLAIGFRHTAILTVLPYSVEVSV